MFLNAISHFQKKIPSKSDFSHSEAAPGTQRMLLTPVERMTGQVPVSMGVCDPGSTENQGQQRHPEHPGERPALGKACPQAQAGSPRTATSGSSVRGPAAQGAQAGTAQLTPALQTESLKRSWRLCPELAVDPVAVGAAAAGIGAPGGWVCATPSRGPQPAVDGAGPG